jgi:copper(I)-binding protein
MNRLRSLGSLLAIVWLATSGLAGCGGDDSSTEATDAPTATSTESSGSRIVVSDVWSRTTPEGSEDTGIAYMVIANEGTTLDRLIAAKTPRAAAVELHQHVEDANGMMRMKMVDGGSIDIPVGESVLLEPGGLHVMLIELDSPLEADTSFPLTLKFESGLELTTEVQVMDFEPEPGTLESFTAP